MVGGAGAEKGRNADGRFARGGGGADKKMER